MNPILEGMQIIAKYDPQFDMCAEHDQIWVGHDVEVSEEDKKRLLDLNWFQDSDADDSWSHFV